MTTDFNAPMGNAEGHRSMRGILTKGNVGFGVLDAGFNMAGGDDVGTAVGKAAVSTALWYTMPGVMGVHLAATTLPAAATAGYKWHQQARQKWNQNFLQGQVGGNYMDTQRALTMRQSAVQAIQGSKLNARSALGGEARILNSNWTR